MRLARPCNCHRPIWDGMNCVRCGRSVHTASAPEPAPVVQLFRSPSAAIESAGVAQAGA
jgi:hypothetical protein